jgi:hypothetical protein
MTNCEKCGQEVKKKSLAEKLKINAKLDYTKTQCFNGSNYTLEIQNWDDLAKIAEEHYKEEGWIDQSTWKDSVKLAEKLGYVKKSDCIKAIEDM